MRILVLLLACCPLMSFGMDRLTALAMLETGNNDRMIGRAGEISRYQILKSEWHAVTNSVCYADPETARGVALTLLERRVRSFRKAYDSDPTDFEFYGLWNAPSQVLQRRVSPRVAERCHRYSNLCEWKGIPTRLVSSSTPASPSLALTSPRPTPPSSN